MTSTQTQTHLWDMETLWFQGNEHQTIQTVFRYKSWSEFQECKPYKLWKPYIVSSWSWKQTSHGHSALSKKSTLECQSMLRADILHDKTNVIEEDGEIIELLQILFISPQRFAEIHRVEIRIKKENEEHVRKWLKNHMPTLWKL